LVLGLGFGARCLGLGCVAPQRRLRHVTASPRPCLFRVVARLWWGAARGGQGGNPSAPVCCLATAASSASHQCRCLGSCSWCAWSRLCMFTLVECLRVCLHSCWSCARLCWLVLTLVFVEVIASLVLVCRTVTWLKTKTLRQPFVLVRVSRGHVRERSQHKAHRRQKPWFGTDVVGSRIVR
jgi:hypothetical protein